MLLLPLMLLSVCCFAAALVTGAVPVQYILTFVVYFIFSNVTAGVSVVN